MNLLVMNLLVMNLLVMDLPDPMGILNIQDIYNPQNITDNINTMTSPIGYSTNLIFSLR